MIQLEWERDISTIRETIIRGCENFDNVLLWQNIAGQRVLIPCLMTTFMPLDNRVVFSFNNSSHLKKFDPSQIVYGRCNERSLIFKSDTFTMSSNELSIPLPSEVRVLENRKFKRNSFGVNSIIYSTIEKFEIDLLGKKRFNLRLYDISQSGASFVVKTNEKKLFTVGESLKIYSFDQFEMKEALECEVFHSSDITQRNETSSFSFRKIGVKFDFHLQKKIYLSILERIINGKSV
ncbi:hypothetical protein A9Q84_12320 [Halobacteriovorax marinus]|uniref:PilZ domain-containing protein n=1 Tax=Halobacteriovorax marinus TaxID=97084 RepID=A0A1Y5F877_9BACT|nr:hypothetical protein A9Q84_12320 [Halobacteriovorax marinus]